MARANESEPVKLSPLIVDSLQSRIADEMASLTFRPDAILARIRMEDDPLIAPLLETPDPETFQRLYTLYSVLQLRRILESNPKPIIDPEQVGLAVNFLAGHDFDPDTEINDLIWERKKRQVLWTPQTPESWIKMHGLIPNMWSRFVNTTLNIYAMSYKRSGYTPNPVTVGLTTLFGMSDLEEIPCIGAKRSKFIKLALYRD